MRAYVPDPMGSDMSCNLQVALSPSSDGVRRHSRAFILARVANSKRVHVYNASGFDLVALNFKVKFFPRNFEDFGGFRHDLRSDHDIRVGKSGFAALLYP